MAEAQQSRVQEAVEEMIQTLERDHIRKIQGRMFRCSAECCEHSGDSMNQVHQCIERCHAPMGKAQAVVTNELQQFQDRLTRCTMHCSDKAKDMFDSGAKEPAMRALMDTCVSACVDEHLKLLPSISRRLQDSLNTAL